MGSNIKITNELEDYINNHSYKLNPIQREIIKHNETLGDKKKNANFIKPMFFFALNNKTI